MKEIVRKFCNYGWLHERTKQIGGMIWGRSFEIDGLLLEAVEQLDNPPPKDYWKGITDWFKSKPWSVPVFFALVALPLLVTWVEMIEKLLRWLGVME